MTDRCSELSGELLTCGELAPRPAQGMLRGLDSAALLGGELLVRLAVQRARQRGPLTISERREGVNNGSEALALEQDRHRIREPGGQLKRPRVISPMAEQNAEIRERDLPLATTIGDGESPCDWMLVKHLVAGEQLVFAGASDIQRLENLASDAQPGERGERRALRLPAADRAEQAYTGLLEEVAPFIGKRELYAGADRSDKRLVAADELLLGMAVVALRRSQERALMDRGDRTSRMRGDHVGAR